MMKKNIIGLMAFLFAASLCTACGDGNESEESGVATDGKVVGKIQIIERNADGYTYKLIGHVTDEVDQLEVIGYKVDLETEESDEVSLGKQKVTNGRFSFVLNTPPSECLYTLADDLKGREVELSDKSVKYGDITIKLLKNGEPVGTLRRLSINQQVGANICYVDRDASITGIETIHDEANDCTYHFEYDVKYKKGWNTLVSDQLKEDKTITRKYTTNNEPDDSIWGVEW
ncbi:hypothetical protein LJB97_00005 [Parabacteroides sp. OttesenSCG-928-O15]|nr:hypothetical protein [Parabacteroides sp. OttesenSCG-928-O15]